MSLSDTDHLNPEELLDLTDKLNLETAKISWKELELFFAKGNLLIVEKNQDLITVAKQIASNEASKIENLIIKQEISFATASWVKQYCLDNPELWAVVVAPYVVAQLS